MDRDFTKYQQNNLNTIRDLLKEARAGVAAQNNPNIQAPQHHYNVDDAPPQPVYYADYSNPYYK